jgi:hypothetical protein
MRDLDRGFSKIAEPLHALKRKNADFVWGEINREPSTN